MKAVKYKVKISIDAVHRWGDKVIDEIFIPEKKIIVNSEGFAFKEDSQRGDIDEEEIDIDNATIDFLVKYVNGNTELKKIVDKLFH